MSHVTDTMSLVRHGARSVHQPLSPWDVGAVSDLRCVANDAEPFHRSLWSWKVDQHMFYGCATCSMTPSPAPSHYIVG